MPQSQAPPGASEHVVVEPGPGRPMWQRVLLGIGAVVAIAAALALALYNFGGMGGSANDPAMKQRYEQLVRSGEITPVKKAFVIPIPGCTCHSTDPRLTEEHRYRRLNQCMDIGCHG